VSQYLGIQVNMKSWPYHQQMAGGTQRRRQRVEYEVKGAIPRDRPKRT